jgi:hypothetical protein
VEPVTSSSQLLHTSVMHCSSPYLRVHQLTRCWDGNSVRAARISLCIHYGFLVVYCLQSVHDEMIELQGYLDISVLS